MGTRLDEGLSLQELEGENWGRLPRDATELMRHVYRLRRIPLRRLRNDDLRMLIGQHVSLAILVPYALEQIEESPLTEAEFYPGDLLASVLRIDPSFWEEFPALRERTSAVLDELKVLPEYYVPLLGPLIEAAEQFPG